MYWALLVLPFVLINTFRFIVCQVDGVIEETPFLRNPGTPALFGLQLPPPAGYAARISVGSRV
jgi:hypothetical protein